MSFLRAILVLGLGLRVRAVAQDLRVTLLHAGMARP